MNAPFKAAPTFALPAELESLSPPPLLLPGESLEKYDQMRHAIFADLAPRSVIEWLLAIDVVELSWEIQRYRILRHKLLEHFRENAIEQTLRHIDLAGLSSETEDHASRQIQRNARTWRMDPTAATEIETRLAAYGYDAFAINTQVYLQARDIYMAFEALLNSAQIRRMSVLREINSRRYMKNGPKHHSLGSDQR